MGTLKVVSYSAYPAEDWARPGSHNWATLSSPLRHDSRV
jgi:hypothetical protein